MEDKPVKFHFIGNQAGNFEDYWKPLMKNIPKNVVLWGERDDVFDFYDACDLFLFTSRGFRYDKELNPLVIKEALEHQIPQFIFPLDVYNRKYDIESDTIHYLFGDIDVDAGLVQNFLFKKELPWESNYLHPYPPIVNHKIRAVHLLLEEDDRKSESIQEMSQLKNYGIDYVQHINKRFTGNPPKEFCERPWDVGRLGAYSLRGPHYGNYTSFRKAILTEFSDDIDFLMILESDCKLTVPIEEFVNKVYESCNIIQQYNIQYMSFGDNKNLRTGEMVSDVKENTTVPWMYVTNKIIGIQCIMFPKSIKNFVQRSYETMLWDVSDLYFNNVFKFKRKGIAPCLTTQIEGMSTIQGENITHFLLKNESNLLKEKNPNDIIIEFLEDKKFHCVLNDCYQDTIPKENIKVDVLNENLQLLYSTPLDLSPNNSSWIQIQEWEKQKVVYFDFTYKNTYLFRKEIIMKKSEEEEKKIEVKVQEKIEDNVPKPVPYEEIINITEKDFNPEFNTEENKINIFYSNDSPSKYKVLVTDIDSNYPIFSKDMDFSKDFYNWSIPSHINYFKSYKNFNGFKVHFYTGDKKEFSKEIRLRNNPPVCNTQFDTTDWSDKDRYYEIFHEEIYSFLKLSSKDECVIDFNDDKLFLIYAKEKGVKEAYSPSKKANNVFPYVISLIRINNFDFDFNQLTYTVLNRTDRILLEYDTNDKVSVIKNTLKNNGFIEIERITSPHNSSYFVKNKNNELISQPKNGEDLFVVLTYPDTTIKEKITKDCISNIKNYTNTKVLVSSHYPLTKEVQQLTDYYLYDSYNPLIEHTLYKFYWSEMDNVKVELNLDKLKNVNRLNQSLTVLNNIENSIRFAKDSGYKRIICVSYDFIFDEENIKTINDICKRLDKENKKGYFMRYVEGNMVLYKTVFFIIDVDFYSGIFTNPRTPEKYNKECKIMDIHNFLEYYFESKLKHHEIDLLIEDTDEEKLFNNPNINIFSGVEYLALIPVKNQSAFVIWYNSNNKKDDRRIDFMIENNGNTECITYFVKERSYYYKKLEVGIYDHWKIRVLFIDSTTNNIINEVNYEVDKDSFISILNNGLFTEK